MLELYNQVLVAPVNQPRRPARHCQVFLENANLVERLARIYVTTFGAQCSRRAVAVQNFNLNFRRRLKRWKIEKDESKFPVYFSG